MPSLYGSSIFMLHVSTNHYGTISAGIRQMSRQQGSMSYGISCGAAADAEHQRISHGGPRREVVDPRCFRHSAFDAAENGLTGPLLGVEEADNSLYGTKHTGDPQTCFEAPEMFAIRLMTLLCLHSKCCFRRAIVSYSFIRQIGHFAWPDGPIGRSNPSNFISSDPPRCFTSIFIMTYLVLM